MKISLEKQIKEIDNEISILSAKRIKLESELVKKLQQQNKSKYFSGSPKIPGIYHYSVVSCARYGGALGEWTGKVWKNFRDWGDFTNRGESIVWYGEGNNRKQPLTLTPVKDLSV